MEGVREFEAWELIDGDIKDSFEFLYRVDDVEKLYKELDRLGYVLMTMIRDSKVPAQSTGLWQHHNYKKGLYVHCLEVYSFMVYALKSKCGLSVTDDIIDKFLFVLAMGHDIAKVYVQNAPNHAYLSANIVMDLIEGHSIDIPDTVKYIIRDVIKYHHLNFDDPESFANMGEGYIDKKLFPLLLLLISADMLSIASSKLNIRHVDALKYLK